MAFYTDIKRLRTDLVPLGEEEVSEAALIRASRIAYNFINVELDGFYTVPFTTVPSVIEDISDLMTKGLVVLFISQQGLHQLKLEDDPGELGLAFKMLRKIASGSADIPGESRLSTRGAYHNMQGYMRIFDLDDSTAHTADRDYIETLDDLRDK